MLVHIPSMYYFVILINIFLLKQFPLYFFIYLQQQKNQNDY